VTSTEISAAKSNCRYAWFVFGCVVFGLLLRAPAFTSGFIADDYAQLAMLDGTYPVERAPWDLYNFSDGSVEEADALRHAGFFPWFTHPQVRLSMLRPLASASIALDRDLFGLRAFPYHLHSGLWWIGLVLAVAFLFDKLLTRPVACIALVLFTVDESQSMPLGWIANRCALGSAFFGTLALIAYVGFRERGRVLSAIACTLWFSLALGFGEYGLGFTVYVATYEAWRFIGARRAGEHVGVGLLAALRPHLLALWPAVAPCVCYLLVRRALGYGPLHSGMYVGPDGDLGGFMWLLLQRVPVLFADLLVSFPSELWNFGAVFSVPLHERGYVDERWLWSSEPWRVAHTGIGLVTMVVGLVLWIVVRSRLKKHAARTGLVPGGEPMSHLSWLVAGGVLSILPVVGSFPSSRLLLISQIGMAAFYASLVVLCLRDLKARFTHARLRTSLVALLGVFVLGFHVIVPARATHGSAEGLKWGGMAARKAVLTMDVDAKRLRLQRLVVISAREYGSSIYLPLMLAHYGWPTPKACWTLSLAPAPHALLRESATAFKLVPMNGVAMLANPPEELFSDPKVPWKPGSVIDLGGMKITVLETSGKYILAIRVETDVPLDDPSLVFVLPTLQGIRRFQMPRIGQAVRIPEPMVPEL
jgi:hypothetical protein